MELSKEILNSGCDILFISQEANKLFNKIQKEIFIAYKTQKKIILDVTDYCSYNFYLLNDLENTEQTLNYTINVTIIMLRKLFVDSNIFYQEKKITNLYDHTCYHKCIVVDWSE